MANAANSGIRAIARHFATKDDAVLGALDALSDLRARPADEEDWTALRGAFDTVIARYRDGPAGSLAVSCLVLRTPVLSAKTMEEQAGWRPLLAAALTERGGTASENGCLRPLVLAAAAVDCLDVAVGRWTDNDGALDLEALVDEAFDVLTPRQCRDRTPAPATEPALSIDDDRRFVLAVA